eukprot:761603-Rhodomonas_salina.1
MSWSSAARCRQACGPTGRGKVVIKRSMALHALAGCSESDSAAETRWHTICCTSCPYWSAFLSNPSPSSQSAPAPRQLPSKRWTAYHPTHRPQAAHAALRLYGDALTPTNSTPGYDARAEQSTGRRDLGLGVWLSAWAFRPLALPRPR